MERVYGGAEVCMGGLGVLLLVNGAVTAGDRKNTQYYACVTFLPHLLLRCMFFRAFS